MATAEHVDRWNGREGRMWAAEYERFEAVSAAQTGPFLDAAGVEPGYSVVDVGCGAGGTTLAAATRAAPDGRVLGVDPSAPLLEVARRRAEGVPGVTFVEADATRHEFEPAGADAVISRSTIMLFDDPAAGLRNLRTALRPGGRLAATVWQDEARNGWSDIPASVIAARLGIERQPPAGPGAFALADPGTLRAAADSAGFVDIDVQPIEYEAPLGADVEDTLAWFERVAGGSLSMLGPPQVVDAIRDDLRASLAAHAGPGGVVVPAAAWLLSARNP